MSWLTFVAIAEILWVAGMCLWIVQERRSATATLAWILALSMLPYVGIAVYLAIGPRRLHRKRRRHAQARSRVHESARREDECLSYPGRPNLAPHFASLAALAERTSESAPVRARSLTVLSTGDDCYQSMDEAIDAARHHLHLEYYIWDPDQTGTRFRDRLIAKARGGVHVRVLLDAIGCNRLGRRFLRPLRDSGAEVAWFNPISLPRFRPGLVNFRTHRKIVICDGQVGFTGGINICDPQSCAVSGDSAWRDTHLRVEGAPVNCLQRLFLENWHFATRRGPTHGCYFPPHPVLDEGPWVQILGSGPDQDLYAIHKFVFGAISVAQQRVWITTPYFVPDEAMGTALTTAALRGVDVRLLAPERSDSRLVDAAARSYFEEMLLAGVRVYLYRPAMLHAKTMVIDDSLSSVGTANMDNRSFRLNFEVAAAIYDRDTNQTIAGQFLDDLRHAKPLTVRGEKRAPFVRRLMESWARLLSPIL